MGLLLGSVTACVSQDKAIQPNDLAATAKRFVETLVKGDFKKARESFDKNLKSKYSVSKLGEAWSSFVMESGPFKKVVTASIEQRDPYDAVFVTCEFEKATLDLQITFDNTGQICGFHADPSNSPVEYSPPTYSNNESFMDKEVIIGTGQWSLPGMLSIPFGKGPFPVVVLVHGSGPNDRDETVGPNKPFRDLAWGLASKGIAVFRYDKRTKIYALKMAWMKKITVKEETIDDAVAAVDLLKNMKQIDSKKIFVLGHSLGGTLIPRIGEVAPEINGFIVMSGSTKPFEDVVIEQLTYLAQFDGNVTDGEKKEIDNAKEQAAKIKDPSLSGDSPERLLGAPPMYWMDLRAYSPLDAVKKVKQPMLFLHGGRDYQITNENFQGWEKALTGRENAQFKTYPQLNHLFITGEGKSSLNEYALLGHVAEEVVSDIADWVKKH